ncbi:transcriptional regulator [Corynebacterium incognita]|uniref:Transcriptional regulator n=1 Tax=Corynebacterium incognita TaxID=2754725 RepID=A0A7G7CP57_9CORY|nr:transcriptional regulator [Corynebacterium incognita]QNE89373.1 transcriptional regulator [Corynebacterium incognita]
MATQHSAPRAAAELFPESLTLSPKQREVLNTLQTFPEGARAADVAAKLGMHVNTARGHLDELVAHDAVRVVTAPAKGRGRPSLIFQVRVPDNRSIAEEYVTLIEVLAGMVASRDDLSSADLNMAREIGTKWARTMKLYGEDLANSGSVLAPVFRRLRDMGFDPTVQPDTPSGESQVDLNACPFTTASAQPSPFICAVHDGFLQEAMRSHTDGKTSLTLIPRSGPGTCAVRLAPAGEERDASTPSA